MPDFSQSIRQYESDLPEEEQKRAGKALQGPMDERHKHFLQTILTLVREKKIDPDNPESFVNADVYASLDDEWKAKTDIAIVNISRQLRLIIDFYESKETPDESPQLQTMLDALWQMKERIEKHADVFVF